MRIVSLTKEAKDNILEDLLKRSPNNYDQYQETVNEILNEVKTKGDEAVFAYTEKFDHAKLTADTLYVTEDEIKEAYEKVDEDCGILCRSRCPLGRVQRQEGVGRQAGQCAGNHA